MTAPRELRRQLIEDGYCVAENILDDAFRRRLLDAVKPLLLPTEQLPDPHFGLITGCQYEDDAFADLIAHPPALQLLQDMGFRDNRWMSFYLIDKPPHAWPLWWHQDWMYWEDPMSAAAKPMQVFLSYYLEDTNLDNGCLKVIPGTHLRRHAIHDDLIEHEKLPKSMPLDHPMFQEVSDAVDVPVKTGDLVIADARLVHAARANRTDVHRSLLLGWYLLDFQDLSAPLKESFSAGFGRHAFEPPHWWTADVGDKVRPLVVSPPTGVTPATRNRTPGVHLKR